MKFQALHFPFLFGHRRHTVEYTSSEKHHLKMNQSLQASCCHRLDPYISSGCTFATDIPRSAARVVSLPSIPLFPLYGVPAPDFPTVFLSSFFIKSFLYLGHHKTLDIRLNPVRL
jgi:hypothetical protein